MTTAHAALGASAASRWTNCPGSVRLSEERADRPSEHARYGTAAHALAERCLRTGAHPMDALDEEIEGVTVDEDMVFIVRDYLHEVERRAAKATHRWIEQRFSLAPLNPPAPMFGTADFVAFVPPSTLLVMDLKAGAGVRVNAKDNLQLRYYALGAWLALPKEIAAQVHRVEMVIVQPRAGGVSDDEMDVLDLVACADDLLRAAEVATQPDAPLKAGDWCRWCRARGACPEQLRFVGASAQAAFDDGAQFDEYRTPLVAEPRLLTDEQLAEAMSRVAVIEQWVSAVQSETMARIANGGKIAGWKMVAKRAQRKWRDEDTAAAALAASVPADALWNRKLISPAQAEKHIPKSQRAEVLAGLIVAESGGPTLAREDDPRPALLNDPFSSEPLFP